MEFDKWLINQKSRDDDIGELASDFVTSKKATPDGFYKFLPEDAIYSFKSNGKNPSKKTKKGK